MTVSRQTALSIMERLLRSGDAAGQIDVLRPRPPDAEPLKPRLPAGNDHTPEGLRRRRETLASQGVTLDHLARNDANVDVSTLEGNIENLIGFASLPVGIVGPLRVNGAYAHDDFYVPMATTEGALVASYNRGAYAVSRAGGATVLCLTESVCRAPCFVFDSVIEAAEFLAWALPRFDSFQAIVDRTSRHCRLVDLRPSVTGKDVFLSFEYTTGDAAGQNMVTIATQAVCEELVAQSPVKPRHWFIEGNLSGDKKATMQGFMYARGKKIVAEARIPAHILEKAVHVKAVQVLEYARISALGGAQSGSIGVQGHFANALAGIFIACGQDVACVAEASVGLTSLDVAQDGALYASVSLPNLIVGTVGGGTHVPTARECLDMLDCRGADRARKFAEICAATALAGEISIVGALAAGHFASAHAKYRHRPTPS